MKSSIPYIYVVDDNSISLKIIQKKIKEILDCNVRTYTTAEECYRTIQYRTPDLILSDYYLDSEFNKRMNGDDFLNKVKYLNPHIPIIIYSSTKSFKLAIRLIKLGAEDFIPRTDNFIEELVEVVEKHFNNTEAKPFLKDFLSKFTW
ncbi:MAG: response regulator [Flavobacteriales bacterium]